MADAWGGSMAVQTWENELTDLDRLEMQARSAEVVTWQGRRALRLDGLALVPLLEVLDASVEVEIGAEGPCYPGIAFGVSDILNYELAYAVPHCSGLWDALQYDPVFHSSNSWQLYHGPGHQQSALVPTGEWFRLHIHLHGGRAAIQVNEQPPLVVDQLAHPHLPGRIGLWTYKPAYFRNLRVSSNGSVPYSTSERQATSAGMVDEWFLDGFGRVRCEPNGILNLNRYLPLAVGTAQLVRGFQLAAAGEVELAFGFSDELSLALDGQECFTGANTFKGFGSYEERGYAFADARRVSQRLEPGLHQLTAKLKVTEGFGWGMILSATGAGLRWLPATSNAHA
jgi:hypothetical protein